MKHEEQQHHDTQLVCQAKTEITMKFSARCAGGAAKCVQLVGRDATLHNDAYSILTAVLMNVCVLNRQQK